MGANDTIITLKGSVEIVTEFFFTAINSILYQRGKLRKAKKCCATVYHLTSAAS
jgi:hypothetical protein